MIQKRESLIIYKTFNALWLIAREGRNGWAQKAPGFIVGRVVRLHKTRDYRLMAKFTLMTQTRGSQRDVVYLG